MLIATWNINGMRARFDYISRWLEARSPDIVGFQELKMTDDIFPHEDFESLGYYAVSHGQKAWNGVAILARSQAPELRTQGLAGQEELGARLIGASAHGIEFTTVYCPNGKDVTHADFPRKLAWFDALADHVREHVASREQAVLCGDFNITPTGLDSWNEKGLSGSIFHTAVEREKYRDLLDAGLVDAFRQRHPDDPGFSWWDYRGGAFHRKRGLRIDMLLLTSALAERVEDVWVDRDFRKKQDGLTPSDHAPVLASIRP